MSNVTLHFVWGHLSRKQTVRRFINDDAEDRLCLSGDGGMCSSSSPGLQSNLIYEFQNIFKMEASILTFTSQHVILVAPQICERYFKIQFSIKPSVRQSCSISIFPYQFNINYPVCLLINTNINIIYFQEGLSISILYQLLKKLPYQFQYQYILSISSYDIVKITNFLSNSHCYQYQC